MPSLAQPSELTRDHALTAWLQDCYADPLAFVAGAWKWPVHGRNGPDTWQAEVLLELGKDVRERGYTGTESVLPIRHAIASGHGIGKSALFAWVVWWIMSTRPNCHGTITANSNDQLDTKTWAAILEWGKACITAPWFEMNTRLAYRRGARESWFVEPKSVEKPEAFQGQHAAGSTSFFIFDEASGIDDPAIWHGAEGGLTDEPMILIGGQPTRNTGPFHEILFGRHRDRWHTYHIDSRTCKLAPHALIREWLEDYGEDSDFFRVRVRGLPPLANELQFIDGTRLASAQHRDGYTLPDDPLVAGVDVSGGGAAWTVCRFRRGVDARAIPPLRITGEQTRDRARIVAALAMQFDQHHDLAAMFVDQAFGSPIVERLHMLGYEHVYEVNFGGDSPDPHFANQRAYMWGLAKEWLARGMIDPADARLATDLGGPGYHLDKKNRLVLEPKESMLKRGLASPDDGDALALTFAMPVRPGAGHKMRAQWLPVPQSW